MTDKEYAEEAKNIEVHIDMMVDDTMRAAAFCSVEHDLHFQVFRLIQGYREALEELAELKKTVKDTV